MKAKCKVVFRRDTHGPAAILSWKGNPINVINYPHGYRVTPAEARRAKKALMRGCGALVREWSRKK